MNELARFANLCWMALHERAFWALVLIAASEYVATWALQRWLASRMDEERRDQLGNGLAFVVGLPWVGRFGMIPFAFVTRRPIGTTRWARIASGALGIFVGLAWVLALSVALFGFEYALTAALGVDLEPKPRRR
jgi:hypothetical protein